ncbi:hypothetical protein [Pseudoalteromonas sp.]|uniref:hypothetical protein n=1 Tax=Pseudoalteromonas sp. TaxID=53249 RepID=UPI002605BAAE|nr:hypothetical protein [Pseudoalteromonas sp.]MCP3865559.1 hypothetical protein [Aestuariibacter sp.]MCP4588923.1 hypothetical protein [Pseudoalteromonas sp.]
MSTNTTDPIWIAYRDSLLEAFFSPPDPNDYVTIPEPTKTGEKPEVINVYSDLVHTTNIRDAVKIMRGVVTEDKIDQLRVRFRSYKYRKSKSKKTLQLEESTHQWIMNAKKDHHFDTVDEALYHLLSPKYAQQRDWQVERAAIADTPLESGNNYIFSLLNRLSVNDRAMVLLTIERAFMDGWSKAKSCRAKKPTARSEATEEYIQPFKDF